MDQRFRLYVARTNGIPLLAKPEALWHQGTAHDFMLRVFGSDVSLPMAVVGKSSV